MSHVGNKGVLALVVAAHAALLWLWAPRVPPAQTPPRRTTVVIIAPPRPLATPEPEDDKRDVPRSHARTTGEARPAVVRRGENAAISLPPPSTVPVATAASQAASAPKPLDLAVRPREALRPSPAGAALNDARSNTQRLSAGERMAQTLGTDTRLRDEIRPDGSVRLRQGTSCFDARQSRATGLDPYNSAIVPKPRQMSAC
jgi:hypothetical protein